MPYNLKLTTGECVHLVTCGHFWSCDKDSIHTTGSTIAANPVLHTDLTALSFIKQSYCQPKLLHQTFTLRE